jgi:hypothetical protein
MNTRKQQIDQEARTRAALLLAQALLCILAAFATTQVLLHVTDFASATPCDGSMLFLFAAIASLTFFHTLELQNRLSAAWKILGITAAISIVISLLIVLAAFLFFTWL